MPYKDDTSKNIKFILRHVGIYYFARNERAKHTLSCISVTPLKLVDPMHTTRNATNCTFFRYTRVAHPGGQQKLVLLLFIIRISIEYGYLSSMLEISHFFFGRIGSPGNTNSLNV